MTSKLNIFNSLPQHASDSEEETNPKNAKKQVKHEKQEQRKQDNAKGSHHGHAAPRDANQKEDVSRQKATHKTKGVTAEPHPNDRHSGTGNQAYGVKPKKGGAGKGNVGNYKEDSKRTGEEVEDVAEESAEPVEEKPEGRTLSEYFAGVRGVTNQPQINEAKSKITSEQLMKEVGKATLLKTRLQQEIDDKNVGKKKDKLNVDHHAGINSEHANLLGFRTGFVEKEYKERTRDEAGQQQQQPRRQYGQKKDKEAAQTEGAETATAEGTEATPAVAEGQTEAAQTQEGQQGHDNQNKRGGYGRGGRGQGRGGDRHYGERRNYGGKQGNTTKVNVEDESAFPKLG